jgi:hypothetical protein
MQVCQCQQNFPLLGKVTEYTRGWMIYVDIEDCVCDQGTIELCCQ